MNSGLAGYLLFVLFLDLAIWLGEANWITALLWSLAGFITGLTAVADRDREQRAS